MNIHLTDLTSNLLLATTSKRTYATLHIQILEEMTNSPNCNSMPPLVCNSPKVLRGPYWSRMQQYWLHPPKTSLATRTSTLCISFIQCSDHRLCNTVLLRSPSHSLLHANSIHRKIPWSNSQSSYSPPLLDLRHFIFKQVSVSTKAFHFLKASKAWKDRSIPF